MTGSIIEFFIDGAEAFAIRAYGFQQGALTIEPVNADVEVRELTVKTLDPDFKGVAVRASKPDAPGRD